MPDIRKLISAATADLQEQYQLFKSRTQLRLRESIDGLEQYGRRPLIRVTGIDENGSTQSENTVAKVFIDLESFQTNILSK